MSRLNNMMDQVKKLKNGIGVQNFLDATHEILGNPVAMFNTDFDLLAYTRGATDDPILNSMITTGTFSDENRRIFESEGFIEEIANAPKTSFLKSKKLKYDMILGKIFNSNNSYVASLIIVACNKPFEESDLMVFEVFCKLITKEISKIDAYQEYEQTHQETVIKNLIDKNYDVKLNIAQVGIIYDSLCSGLYVAVVDISQCCSDEKGITYFRDLLKQAAPSINMRFIPIILSS